MSGQKRQSLLVGSLPFANEAEAAAIALDRVGPSLNALPDGEIGERTATHPKGDRAAWVQTISDRCGADEPPPIGVRRWPTSKFRPGAGSLPASSTTSAQIANTTRSSRSSRVCVAAQSTLPTRAALAVATAKLRNRFLAQQRAWSSPDMKFSVFYEHQLPKPWTVDDEFNLLQEVLDHGPDLHPRRRPSRGLPH